MKVFCPRLILCVSLIVSTPLIFSEVASAGEVDRFPEVRLAQYNEDAYDPFADFSEFEDSAEEEADINFFQNGRFFTLGFIGGYRRWTGTYGDIFDPGTSFGLFISYFFDLRFALQVSFQNSDHPFRIEEPGNESQGNLSLTALGIDLKYYLNTQNVTRGLANLNPYFFGGFSQFYRTFNVSGADYFGKDSALGVNVGGGIEIPMLRNKMFFGLQGAYHIVTFDDENNQIEGTDLVLEGDHFSISGVLGVNF